MDQFTTLQRLGQGGYSTVSLVRRRPQSPPSPQLTTTTTTNTLYALKIISKSKVQTPTRAAHVFAERAALEALTDCPFVITLFDTFKDDAYLYFLLESVDGGPLHRHLRGSPKRRFSIQTT